MEIKRKAKRLKANMFLYVKKIRRKIQTTNTNSNIKNYFTLTSHTTICLELNLITIVVPKLFIYMRATR